MTVTDPQAQPVGPYATAAHQYLRAGFAPLPIPYGQKKPVPEGWTGNDGAWPSYADVQAWVEDRGGSNVGLRLPPNVLGLDTDHYGSKPGGALLAALEQRHGALPPTWRVTSRDDGQSGIRLYRIPEGLRWPGVLGPGIETLRYAHRYAVAWPSIHPDTQKPYRWITPDGAVSLTDVPTVDELPALPQTWVDALTGGALATDQPRANLTGGEALDWLLERGGGEPCRVLRHVLERGRLDLAAGGSRHDAALALSNRIAWLAGEGHRGGLAAIHEARLEFMHAMVGDRDDLDGEWNRMVSGAIRLAAAAHPNVQPDPCDDPFAGLIPKKDDPWKAPAPAATSPSTTTPPATSATPPDTSSTTPETPPSSPAQTATEPESATAERTSWWPRNLDAVLDGRDEEEPPTHLSRNDGHRFFYAGKVNGIIGPSESGKSWIALQAVVEAVHEEQQSTIIDFEDSHTGVIGRLGTLGLTPAQIRRFVAYINPDEVFSRFAPSGDDLLEHLGLWTPELIVIDGVNAAMTLQGLDLISNKDATTFAQHILKPLAATGACVLYVDHTPKSKDNTAAGGIGAQAKRAMTTGCTLKIDPIKPFGKGQDGKLRAYVDKDRAGHVRGVSLPSNGTHWAADIIVTPSGDQISLAVQAPEGYDATSGSYTFRPTILMERISDWLADNPGAGRNEILAGVRGDDKKLKPALAALISEGWVSVDQNGQKHPHSLVAPFSDLLPSPTGGVGVTGGEPGVSPLGGWGGGHTISPPPPPRLPKLVSRTVAGRLSWVHPDTGAVFDNPEGTP